MSDSTLTPREKKHQEKKEFLEVKLRNSQAVSFCNCLSRTNYLIAASSQKSRCPAKHGKPLSDGDIIITAVLSVSNSLFHDLDRKTSCRERV